MKKLPAYLLAIMSLFYLQTSLAWNAVGHEVVAQIAYEHLKPQVKLKIKQQLQILAPEYPQHSDFVTAAVWADLLKGHDVRAFNTWHYINIPYKVGNVRAYRPARENVVWAILQSEKVIQSPNANNFEKGMFLRFLLHFVGDIHQPLHCINRFSRHYPHGDAGGHRYPIRARDAKNLHQFWDQGLGLLDYNLEYNQRSQQITALAAKIQKAYPPEFFGAKTSDLNPKDWANQSYQIAQKFAYQIPRYGRPTKEYVTEGQKIVQQQLALAGYRLANLLNQLYGQ